MGSRNRWFVSILVAIVINAVIPLSATEQDGLLESLPADILASLTEGDLMAATRNVAGGMLNPAVKNEGSLLDSLPFPMNSAMKDGGSILDSIGGGGVGATMKMVQNVLPKPSMKQDFTSLEGGMPFMKAGAGFSGGGIPIPIPGGKMLKAAPLKKVAVKKVVGAKLMAPKLKKVVALKAKPKVYSLKPIVHVVEKSVPVFHKVPVPKKVMVPKFYKVMKPIPIPKIVPVPFKVPVKKIIPKIVKIPKAVPVPKFYPVKKFIPIGIPYPVPKFFKVPIPKPMPYKKYIPIPIPKKVPKFIPVPIKKIIKVPKPFYVPIKVPYITTSYMKTPMVVKVPNVKKMPMKGIPFPKPMGFQFPQPIKGFEEEVDFIPTEKKEFQQQVNFIPNENKPVFKVKDKDSDMVHGKH